MFCVAKRPMDRGAALCLHSHKAATPAPRPGRARQRGPVACRRPTGLARRGRGACGPTPGAGTSGRGVAGGGRTRPGGTACSGFIFPILPQCGQSAGPSHTLSREV